MNTTSLKLNDFESFQNFLFTKGERKKSENEKWEKYVKKELKLPLIFIPPINNPKTIEEFQLCYYSKFIFCPPINNPKTIEEFQLCHYAYWMCISNFTKNSKMLFIKSEIIKQPLLPCYACEYVRKQRGCLSCPINEYNRCPKVYYNWIDYVNNKEKASKLAEEIAYIKWQKS